MVMTIFAFVCVPCGEVRGGGPWPTARVGCHLTVHYLLLRVVDLLHIYNLDLSLEKDTFVAILLKNF